MVEQILQHLLQVLCSNISPPHPIPQVPVLLPSAFLSSLQLPDVIALFSVLPNRSNGHCPHSQDAYRVVEDVGKVAAVVIVCDGCFAGQYLRDLDQWACHPSKIVVAG